MKNPNTEKNFTSFFEAIEDLVFVGNQQGNIYYSNKSATDKLGYSKEEFSGMHILDIHPENRREEAEENFSKIIKGEKSTCMIPFSTRDGRLIPMETRVWFSNWNDEPCLFGLCKDLTKEQEATQKFSKLFDRNPSLMAVNVLPGREFTEVNQAFLNVLGYTKEEVLGKSAHELNIFVDSENQKEISEQLHTNGFIHNVELKIQTKSGKILVGLFSGETINSQGKDYFLTVMIDITERKHADEEIKIQSGLKQILMELSSTYINLPLELVDMEINKSLRVMGQFVGADRAYIFDYQDSTGRCSNTFEWCNTDITAQIQELQDVELGVDWIQQFQKGETIYIPDVSSLPPGYSRDLLESQDIKSLIAVPMMNNKVCVGFIGFDSVLNHHIYTEVEQQLLSIFAKILISIILRKETEKSLIHAKEEAEESNRLKSAFLANMSHEIRTPMNAILGFLDLMKNMELTIEEKSNFIDIIDNSGHRLLDTINDILEISKIESGQMQINLTDINLEEEMKFQFHLFSQQAKAKGLTFNLANHIQGEIAIIQIDKQKINSILSNLIKNALKFTKEGFIELGNCLKEDSLIFYVKDSGIGIPSNRLTAIFDSFVQADLTNMRPYEGSGLGLSIVRAYIEMLNGKIWVESEVNKGSTFYFSIPYKTSNKNE